MPSADKPSRWVGDQQSVTVFEGQFQPIRTVFKASLSHGYNVLGQELQGYRLLDPSTPLLYLGIGTGQEATMLQIPGENIFAVDASADYITRAQQPDRLRRLAGSQQGFVPDVLNQLSYYPVAFASEMLDCIPPKDLPTTAKALYDHAATVVVAQSLFPDEEYYNTFSPDPNVWSYGRSGIEGWTPNQRQLVENHLRDVFDITADPFTRIDPADPQSSFDPAQTDLLFTQLQGMVEKSLGYTFSFNIADLLNTTLQMGSANVTTVAERFMAQGGVPLADRSYISRITGFISLFANALGQFDQSPLATSSDPRLVDKYAKIHTIRRFFQIMQGTLLQESHFTLVADSLKKAGYTQVTRKAISTDAQGIISDEELAKKLDDTIRAVFAQKDSLATKSRYDRGAQNKIFVLGMPGLFMDSTNSQYEVARIQYLVAA